MAKKSQRSSNTFKSLRTLYQDLIVGQYALVVNAFQSSILTAIGVIISQIISHDGSKGSLIFDWEEIRVMCMIVAFYNTPILMWFFNFLSKSNLGVIGQLLLDQFVFAPPFTAGILSLRAYYLTKTPLLLIPMQVLAILPKAQMTGWMFWIPCRFLILKFVPPNVQLLAVNICALIWNVIFSLVLK
eukprot:gene4260-8481_t